MKEFFEYIKAQINARVVTDDETPVPLLKTVRMWNNQFMHSNEKNERKDKSTGARFGYRNEKPFPYPACFVEFIVNDVNNLALGVKDYLLTVRFRFGVEAYKFERLDTFDFCDAFSQAIQLLAPSEESGLTFTTFQEVQTEFDEDFNNVETPYIDYRVRYRSSAAYKRVTDVAAGPIDPIVNGEVDAPDANEDIDSMNTESDDEILSETNDFILLE